MSRESQVMIISVSSLYDKNYQIMAILSFDFLFDVMSV